MRSREKASMAGVARSPPGQYKNHLVVISLAFSPFFSQLVLFPSLFLSFPCLLIESGLEIP